MANKPIKPDTLDKIADILAEFGQRYVDEAKDNLSTAGAIASGDLFDSIRFTTEVMGENVVLQVFMEDYAEFVDEGRDAGRFPPVNEIKQWIRDKGITYRNRGLDQRDMSLEQQNNTLAYLIGRDIAEHGTPATNFIPNLPKKELVSEIESRIADDVAKDIADSLQINLS